ncbi:TrkH family potassium uptake protein [Alkalibacter rhizosphaerae]|uniref:TrkH family potassium uptake protein n=1 Tax=Alkalibacter rhizosphaerae TaxID=2815577 RepID=A0A974XEM3_9FIRM|nr:potassium transporter TrkG [Alkalibacter rhizosphaerae]QSX08444.1 TrkH family potassium uptake protein [Alkalibacter rhizosphaerae]
MNYGIVVKILGSILIIDSFFLVPPLLIALIQNERSTTAFAVTLAVTLIAGFLMSRIRIKNKEIKAKEGLAIVTFGWLAISISGAFPFYLGGSVPTYIDALFETISGFTTTGASIISNVEVLDKSIQFWRSFTHWIGGMGILVFTIALLPAIGMGSFHLFKAESPGPMAGKIAPRIKDTARFLYISYISLTLLEIIFLRLGGLSFFDSAVYTFGTVGTGGFGVYNDSVAGFSSYIHFVIGIFMVLSGINFSLHFYLYTRRFKEIVEDTELRNYLRFILFSTVLIMLNLFFTKYGNLFVSFRDSFFQVSSIMTTTGYSTADFDLWPTFSKLILFVLMFVGGSAGSTGGGIKVIRIVVLMKLIKREVSKIFHPRAYAPVKLGRKAISNDIVARVNSFVALHVIVFILGSLLISLEGVDFLTAISSVAATLNNIGPGFEMVGPTTNFAFFSGPSKLLLSFLMLLGRLELFTVLALLVPGSWTKES